MFQRRHYVETAKTLATVYNIDNVVIERMSIMFQRDNGNYIEQRFFDAFRHEYQFTWGEPYPFALRGRYDHLMG
jgi:hypothetical protein